MGKDNTVQEIINGQIHYYDMSYSLILEKIIPKLKIWTVIFGILHLVIINKFAEYVLEINKDGVLFVLPPFINIIVILLPFTIFEFLLRVINKHNDINYIIQYYPEIAEKLWLQKWWLPLVYNGFAWIDFINYEYIKQGEDKFIDNIIDNAEKKRSMYCFVFFGNIIIIFLSIVCLLYRVL